MTQIVRGIRHNDTYRLPGGAHSVRDAMAPVVAKLQAMHGQLDALKAKTDRIKAHRDAVAEAERNAPPPRGYVRDASGEIRPRTTADDAAAANQAYGKDAKGTRPGSPGFDFDGEAMWKAGVPINEINDYFWGKRPH